MSLIKDPLLCCRIAILVVFAATVVQAHRARLDPWTMYLAAMAGLGGALLMSWIYVALFAQFSTEIGGRASIGAFIGAAASGWLILKIRGRDFLSYADAGVPGIALGYAVYRIGCFVNGCCFGIPTDLPWGVTFPPGTDAFAFQVAQGWIAQEAARTLPVHPTQLYHAAFGAVLFFTLLRWRVVVRGSRLALALALYGTGRFALEFLRAHAMPVLGPLDVNQLASLGMLMVAFIFWRFRSVSGTLPPVGQPS